ncbi:MAG: Crp/Fnr family transcriptional regulator [Bacteroidia bacterium]|nr:Crp/Fnr family transcriptional regulator [Bacteroidia bacterium]
MESHHLQQLRALLDRFVVLQDGEFDRLVQKIQFRRYAKGDFFVRSGDHCQYLGFLLDGVARVFLIEKDKEFSSFFNFGNRNPLVCSFASFLNDEPSRESIHFLEDSALLLIRKDQLDSLYEGSFNLQKLGRLMAEHNYVLALERIYSLQFLTAPERYDLMLRIYPNLINRIPQHHIASYLGITPESLSRVRRQQGS